MKCPLKVFLIISFTTCLANAEDIKPLVLPWLNITSSVSEKVQKFLDSSDENADAKSIKTSDKHDVLGRTVTSTNMFVAKPKSIENKMNVRVSYRDIPEFEGQPIFARYESNQAKIFLNDSLISSQEYFEKIKDFENIKINPNYGFSKEMTADEIKSLLNSNAKVLIQEDSDVNPLLANSTSNPVPFSSVLGLSEISQYAHANGYNGSGINVYFSEIDCPNTSYINQSKFHQYKTNCSGNIGAHATAMTKIFQMTAPQAMLSQFNQGQNPTPVYNGVRFDIGFHSENVSGNQGYLDEDEILDNYIFNGGVTVFVSAGNQYNSSGTYYVSSPAKALNAISVGAVSAATGLYESYSRRTNSNIGNQKPEILNYTNFNFPYSASFTDSYNNVYNGVFSGTSSATAYTAGLMADILHQHPFFKQHPEMVKALLITGSTQSVSNYTFDADNYTMAARAVPLYPSLAWNTRSAYWNGSNSDFFVGDSISFNESGIVAGKRYRIAIAWLMPGTYVNVNKTVSQDIDLYVYQDGHLVASSASAKNPFEVVDFIASSSSDLRVKIYRYANSGVGGVKLGYNMWIGY